jgi:SPFH domain / Band 7 family
MARSHFSDENNILADLFTGRDRWKRRAILLGGILAVLVVLFLVVRYTFFRYVPAGEHLVIVSKNGDPLDPGEVLAKPGQKGIQRDVLGEGFHFVMPVIYATQLEKNTVIPSNSVGIVTALGGRPPRDGRVLADQEDEQGIRRQVLLPGAYRLNLQGYRVEVVPMERIEPGFVGVKRRKLGVDGTTQFANNPTEKGIIKDDVLQPGIYPINTKEYEVVRCEVGIYQTSYHYSENPRENTALTFYGKDGSSISLDCTIEWEVQPKFWPVWLTRFRTHREIEEKVVNLHAKQICQVRGSKFGAQDFLEGIQREKFQDDFRNELSKVCEEEHVFVRSAFIRNIVIPDKFLSEKREQRLAVETKLTAEALTLTAQTTAEVAEAKKTIDARVAEVQAETTKLVAIVARDTENVRQLTEAQIEKLKAEYGAMIAEKEAERTRVMGEAEAEAKKLQETAKSSLYKMKLGVFNQDGDAYLRYTLAQQLNPKFQLRLFQSGPGTLWTNMGNKNMNFMLPLGGAGAKKDDVKSPDVKTLQERSKSEK